MQRWKKVEPSKLGSPPTTVYALPRRRARSQSTRFFRLLLLVITAATLSALLPSSFLWSHLRTFSSQRVLLAEKDSEGWKDDIWPLRNQTAWDISTDFPYPRTLEYDVQEGTWLRLDVHPKTGDIIFDMVGDLYCLPGSAYLNRTSSISLARTKAIPVLTGVPYDSDPHFSPDGKSIVFRSDAELGVENIWVRNWTSCEEKLIEGGAATYEARVMKEEDRLSLARGVPETAERKARRLLQEGRSDAIRVTNETYRWVSDARFHPSGQKVIATKWYTSERSLGAGEGWEYDIPSEKTDISVGSGQKLVGRTLPPGWDIQQYGDQQIGPEQFIWNGKNGLIFSKNIVDQSTFDYSKDVHSGIYAIFAHNLTTNTTTTLVDAFPGGASRPELSRDGKTLAFVRRVRDKEALVLKDLESGTIHHVWYGLSYDLSTISAPMGTYPSFAFSPSDDAVVIWAAGQIYHIPLETNHLGEKVTSKSRNPSVIPFTAHIEKLLADTRSEKFDLTEVETADTQRAYAFKELRADDTGELVVFQAAGKTYAKNVNEGPATLLPVVHTDAPYYSPAFVPGASHFVIHVRWDDTGFSTLELADIRAETAYEFTGLPLGRYYSPVLCACTGAHRTLAFIKTGGDHLTGDIVATAKPGLYVGQIFLPKDNNSAKTTIQVDGLHFVPTEINVDDVTQLRFEEGNTKLVAQQSRRAFVIDLAKGPINDAGDYNHTDIALGRMSAAVAVSGERDVAVIDYFQVWFLSKHDVPKEGDGIWSKPGSATKGLKRVSLDGGHDITWSGDGKRLFWFLGPYLHVLDVSKFRECASVSGASHDGCSKNLLPYFLEVEVSFSTDIARLRSEIPAGSSGSFVIYNATVLDMGENSSASHQPIRGGVLVSQGGVITSIGQLDPLVSIEGFLETKTAEGSVLLNAQGGYIIPGFIDVHAHWEGFSVRYPANSWELETFLAYGVTTLHNPSADNVDAFIERGRVERGQTIGPRIFSVGDVIYGAGSEDIHQSIADMDEARSALVRIKVEGGPGAISYKNYNQPSRASRQRLLLAARNISMLCVPEGGMNYDWDLTYILDGMTTVEHAMPVPKLYDDVLILFAQSGTGNTPTHIVNYGGAFGEQYVWATEDLPDDPKLRRFTRHDILEGLSESTSRPRNSYALFNTSQSVANMVHMGLKAHIGAHGEPPLGENYHAEMWFAQQGGLSNYEVLRAATYDAAVTLGLESSIGSLSEGKLADFLIYNPEVDLLHDDISASRKIKYVVRGGRVWDASTMEEFWPVKGRKRAVPPFNAD